MTGASADDLQARFEAEVWAKIPRSEGGAVANPTPLVDVTDDLLECAKTEYGLKLSKPGVRVLAKFDSKIPGGSVKVRPAARILRDAISSGRLRGGDTIFEATSGNFGIALGMAGKLGLGVVALVSRKLQGGVTSRLEQGGVRLINLDIEICPVPGIQAGRDIALAKAVASNVREQLADLGYAVEAFDGVRTEAEELLARQDAIGLAKLLATAYGGFCTEQYDNELNVDVHRSVTGPELDQQLTAMGTSLRESDFVCAFGTGGTAGGVSRYIASRYGRKGVRVVFPLPGQDVAGIRTKDKARGLTFYEPESYLGEHEADFEDAGRLFDFFNRRGHDVGESGALALYASMQLANYGEGEQFVVMVADGSSKYTSEMEPVVARGKKGQVNVKEAAGAIEGYAKVLWTHSSVVPSEEGIGVIVSSLGVDREKVDVADVSDVLALLEGREPSEGFRRLLASADGPLLTVCVAGTTSFLVAKELEKVGVAAVSLIGGISGLPGPKGKPFSELLKAAGP